MKENFWQNIKKPIFALAPMANVTDAAFRRIIVKYGKPDIVWTEFVSAEGLLSRGREKLLPDFWFSEAERPIVAQVFGGKPEQFEEVAKLIVSLGFDGIDINMGCPDRGVERSGGGAALIKEPKLAQEIILATKRGAGTLPVSVKTRIGYNKNELEAWLPALFETSPAAITLHARTRKEMSAVPAHWDAVQRAVALRDSLFGSPSTGSGRLSARPLIIGNGDVQSVAEAREKAEATGADGIMLGRAIFGNPWLFRELAEGQTYIPTTEEKLRVCLEHMKLFEELFGERAARLRQGFGEVNRVKSFEIMKKHFKAYITGFDGAKELRLKMMEAEGAGEVEALVQEFSTVALAK